MIAPTLRPAAPCADCRTEEGHAIPGNRRPSRMSGKRFGIDGPLCWSCYYRLRYQHVVRPRRIEAGAGGR